MLYTAATRLAAALSLCLALSAGARADAAFLRSAFLAGAGMFRSAPAVDGSYAAPPLRVQAQVLGQRCVTRIGTCAIEPQPVGSPCSCGTVKGVTSQ